MGCEKETQTCEEQEEVVEQCNERKISITNLELDYTDDNPNITVEGLEIKGKFNQAANPILAILTEFAAD